MIERDSRSDREREGGGGESDTENEWNKVRDREIKRKINKEWTKTLHTTDSGRAERLRLTETRPN